MVYAKSLTELVRSAGGHGIPVSLESAGAGRRDIVAAVFGDALADEITDAGYPGGIEIPLAVEDLYIYPLDELQQRQVGYRSDGRTGMVCAGWDADRHVIADWAANPVSIDSGGGLAYSMHGRGEWIYFPIAPDLAAFLSALARWIDYCRGERAGRILDDDFELLPDITCEVLQRLSRDLSDVEAANFTRFLLGSA